jgi:N-acetylneuraminic acid mutarotase
MHQAVASFGAVASDGWLYVAGGHVGRTHDHSLENLTARVVRYALNDLSIAEELPPSTPLQSVALVAAGGDVYRIGGMTARNATAWDDADLLSVDAVARLDADAGAWTAAWPLPGGRSSHDAVAVDGRIYVFGGWSLDGESSSWCETGLVLDTVEEQPAWRPIEQPFQRRALAVAAAGGRIYCIGGMTSDGEMSDRVDVYDLATESWSEGPELPCGGFGITAIGGAEELLVAGTDGVLYSLAADDGGGASWEARERLALARRFARIVRGGEGRVLVAGGVGDGAHVAVMEELTPRRALSAPRLVRMELPFRGAGRQRHAAFVHGDALYLFGGNVHAEAHRFEQEDFTTEGWRVDLLTGVTAQIASLPEPRQSMAVATTGGLDERVYLAGGFAHSGVGTRSWSDVFAYDPAEDRFEVAPATLPASLSQLGLAGDRGSLFAVGGLAYSEDGESSVSAECTTWNPANASEPFVAAFGGAPALDAPRRAFAGAKLGDEYVVVGGMGEGFDVHATAVAIDLQTGATRAFPAPEHPRVSGKMVALDGRLYLAGGASKRAGAGLEPDRTVEVFEPEVGRWRELVDDTGLPDARHVHAFAWNDRLLLATAAREGVLDLVWLKP